MKATELMIGDWVMSNKRDEKEIVKVVSIDSGTNCCWLDSDCYSGLVACEDIEPIPLTPEILEKNGWNSEHIDSQGYPSDADWYYYNWNIPTRYAKISGKENMIFLDCSITYVHELQHCLRICGLEELADNFKL